MEKTLIHEDIYVYVDKIFEQSTIKKGTSSLVFVNDASGNVVDKGILKLENEYGAFSKIKITCGESVVEINKNIDPFDILVLDFRNNFYTINGNKNLFENIIEMKDNTINELKLEFTGSGRFIGEYIANIPDETTGDLLFCTSVDVSTSNDIMSFKNIKGVTKNYKNAHGTHSWSINIIWNEDEAEKFNSPTGKLRIRLIDLDGRELESLGNCYVNSIQKGSSDSGDYTLNVGGVCDKIF